VKENPNQTQETTSEAIEEEISQEDQEPVEDVIIIT